jgi:hypothetical protein
MCSFKLLAVLQAFSLSDLIPDWKSAARFICTSLGGGVTELRTHEQGLQRSRMTTDLIQLKNNAKTDHGKRKLVDGLQNGQYDTTW